MALTPGTSTVGGVAATATKTAFPIFGALGAVGGILGSLFGGQKPPSANDLRRLFGPGALAGDTQQLYQFLSQSPQFRQQLSQNLINASGFEHNLRGGLAARGLTTSGVGTIATAAGQSAGQYGEQALRGGLFGTAGDMAQQNLLARLQAFMQSQQMGMQQPSGLQRLGGGLALAGGQAQSLFGGQ